MEKYGTVPKKFTKGWWEWFWEYYKIHVIAGAFVLLAGLITVYQFATRVDYDITVTYIGKCTAAEKQINKISEELEEVILDVNGNKKKDVMFQVMTTSDAEVQNAQYTMAIETKKMIELQMGETFLYIINKEQMNNWYENGLAQDTFVPADEWLNDENKTCERAEGEGSAYFVKLISPNILTDAGLEADEELFVGVRAVRETDEEKEAEAALISSCDAANYLLAKR